jgi:RNA polymerase sigma factor (sigma-70 family)
MLYIGNNIFSLKMSDRENQLVELLKKGDELAFRQLVEKNQDRVYNTCLGFVRNEDEADDLAQEVFIEVFRSIHTFRHESKLSTWLYRIAVTKSLEFIRSKKRLKRFAILRSLFMSDNETEISIPNNEHPGVLAENRERSMLLSQAIEKLPEHQRIAFTLHKIEGLNHIEISEIMGKSISSVESLMHRARLNLQEFLKNYYNS